MMLATVDVVGSEITVMGKGQRERRLYMGRRGMRSLDRYLRARRRHTFADEPGVWLGQKGVLSKHSLQRIIRTRGAEAIPVIS